MPVRSREPSPRRIKAKQLVGIDVFVDSTGSVEELASQLRQDESGLIELGMITNRGVKVWPQGLSETFCTDHWRCRFMARPNKQFNPAMIVELLRTLHRAGIDVIKTENLYTFDGEPGFSLGQGQ